MIPGTLSKPELNAYLSARPDRCSHGFATSVQTCPDCPNSEWDLFVTALRESVGADGLIHQTSMRPRIQSIHHKHRGSLYVKAKAAGLIEFAGKEPSTDAVGKNLDKDQKVYRWLGAAVSERTAA